MSDYWTGNIHFVESDTLNNLLGMYKKNRDRRRRKVLTLTHPAGIPITNKQTWYAAMVATFPMNPGLTRQEIDTCLLGALIDSLHGGLRGLEEDILDVVWPAIDAVGRASMATMINGISILDYALWGFLETKTEENRQASARLLLTYRRYPASINPLQW